MKGFRRVGRHELESFVESRGATLTRDVCGIYEPPIATYNDFSRGDWPESSVAIVSMGWLGGNGETDFESHGKFWTYWIREEF